MNYYTLHLQLPDRQVDYICWADSYEEAEKKMRSYFSNVHGEININVLDFSEEKGVCK